jgi:hypothetical protein
MIRRVFEGREAGAGSPEEVSRPSVSFVDTFPKAGNGVAEPAA